MSHLLLGTPAFWQEGLGAVELFMAGRCANPVCGKEFTSGEGQLYEFEVAQPPQPGKRNVVALRPRKRERYWLCDRCSALMTMKYRPGVGVFTAPLPGVETARAS